MTRLFKMPLFWLIAQAVLMSGVFIVIFSRAPVQYYYDSKTYMHFGMDNLMVMLSQIRTIGYPIFIKLIQLASPKLALLPYAQLALIFGAILFLFKAMRIYGLSSWGALFAVSPLYYQRIIWEYVNSVMSEVVGAAFAIYSAGFLFLVVARRGGIWAWLGLVLSVAAAYQVRPAYLFLVPLFPILAAILFVLRNPPLQWKAQLKRILIRVSIGLFVPLIAFCTLRLAVVNNFGLVSFTGFHIMGITMQFLDKDVASGMNKDLRPLALALIEAKEKRGLTVPPGRFTVPMPYLRDYSMDWQAIFVDSTREFLKDNPGSELIVIKRPVMPNSLADVDGIGLRLAFSILKARPFHYMVYYAKSLLYGVSFTLYVEGTIVFLLFMLFTAYIVVTWDRLSSKQNSQRHVGMTDCFQHEFAVILYVGALFYICKLILIVLVEPIGGRYLMAAAMFIPSIIAVAIYELLKGRFNIWSHHRLDERID